MLCSSNENNIFFYDETIITWSNNLVDPDTNVSVFKFLNPLGFANFNQLYPTILGFPITRASR